MADWNNRWERILTLGQMLRGGGSESRINTQEGVTLKTRVMLPVAQAATTFVGFMGFMGGIMLFTGEVSWLLDLDWGTNSYVAAWIIIVSIAVSVVWGVQRAMKHEVLMFRATVATFLLLLLGIAVFSLLRGAEDMSTWRVVKFFSGAGLILSCMLLMYNLTRFLIEPYWPKSPFETAFIQKLLPALVHSMWGDDEEKPVTVNPFTPRITANGRPVTAAPLPEPKEEPERELPRVKETIDPEAGNLIWFALWALGCLSLTISDLTRRPAPYLPYEEVGQHGKLVLLRLRRKMIRVLLARGSTNVETVVDGKKVQGLGEAGWWHLRGQGATAEWAMDKEEVREQVEAAWREVMGDAPLPDPHNEAEYVLIKQ